MRGRASKPHPRSERDDGARTADHAGSGPWTTVLLGDQQARRRHMKSGEGAAANRDR